VVSSSLLRKPLSLFLLCVFVLGAGVNCGAAGQKKEGEIRFEKRELVIEKAGGERPGAPGTEVPETLVPRVPIRVEIARTDDERARGLMNRPSLPDGEGMLFVFEREQILSFWMKNTLIPLSIAFIRTDGRIAEIRDMQALDVTTVSSARSARYALEVPQGWFTRAGIDSGDYLRLGPEDLH
jgi:uncharacterized membrane protein (UPF0127 family)